MNNFYKVSPRRKSDPLGVDWPCKTASCGVAASLACGWMGSGNSKASTSTSDNRVAATGLSRVQQDGSVAAEGEAIVVKEGSKILAPGSVENTGTLTVTGASDELVKNVLQGTAEIARDASERAAQANSNLSEIVNGAFTQVSGLAEQKIQEGETARNKMTLLIILGLLAMLAFVFQRR